MFDTHMVNRLQYFDFIHHVDRKSLDKHPHTTKHGSVSHYCKIIILYVKDNKYATTFRWQHFIMFPTVGKRAISVAWVRLSVRPSVVYIANNSRTQKPSTPKFGRKVPHLRCDSHTSLKVKRSKVRVGGGRGIPCRLNPEATLLV